MKNEKSSGPETTLLITKAELAKHFRCSERQVDKLTAEGRIPTPIMLGNTRRWSRAVITAWIAKLSHLAESVRILTEAKT